MCAGRTIADVGAHQSAIHQRGVMLADYAQHLETEAIVGEVCTTLWPSTIQGVCLR